MPGNLEQLLIALLAPKQSTRQQTIQLLAMSFENLDPLTESIQANYPLDTAIWQADGTTVTTTRWGECVWG